MVLVTISSKDIPCDRRILCLGKPGAGVCTVSLKSTNMNCTDNDFWTGITPVQVKTWHPTQAKIYQHLENQHFTEPPKATGVRAYDAPLGGPTGT